MVATASNVDAMTDSESVSGTCGRLRAAWSDGCSHRRYLTPTTALTGWLVTDARSPSALTQNHNYIVSHDSDDVDNALYTSNQPPSISPLPFHSLPSPLPRLRFSHCMSLQSASRLINTVAEDSAPAACASEG